MGVSVIPNATQLAGQWKCVYIYDTSHKMMKTNLQSTVQASVVAFAAIIMIKVVCYRSLGFIWELGGALERMRSWGDRSFILLMFFT